MIRCSFRKQRDENQRDEIMMLLTVGYAMARSISIEIPPLDPSKGSSVPCCESVKASICQVGRPSYMAHAKMNHKDGDTLRFVSLNGEKSHRSSYDSLLAPSIRPIACSCLPRDSTRIHGQGGRDARVDERGAGKNGPVPMLL